MLDVVADETDAAVAETGEHAAGVLARIVAWSVVPPGKQPMHAAVRCWAPSWVLPPPAAASREPHSMRSSDKGAGALGPTSSVTPCPQRLLAPAAPMAQVPRRLPAISPARSSPKRKVFEAPSVIEANEIATLQPITPRLYLLVQQSGMFDPSMEAFAP